MFPGPYSTAVIRKESLHIPKNRNGRRPYFSSTGSYNCLVNLHSPNFFVERMKNMKVHEIIAEDKSLTIHYHRAKKIGLKDSI